MDSAPAPTGAVALEWERFESPDLGKIVVDASVVEDNDAWKSPVQAPVENTKRDDGSHPPDLDSRRIASMFQANNPNTDSNVEVGYRPSTAESTRSGLQPSRPATAVPQALKELSESPENAIFTAIFSIDKTSYDVCMFEDKITWTPISTTDVKKPLSRSESKDASIVQRGMVFLHELCSVRLKNIRNTRANTVTTVGFVIARAVQKGEKLRQQITTFLCFSRDICVLWATKIKTVISARPERPRRLLTVTPQSIAMRQIWDDIIESRFETVAITGKFTEINRSKSVSEYIEKILADQTISQGPDAYEGILVLGKASFFTEALNTFHKFKKEMLRSGTWHPNFPTIGFIPSSSTSFVAKELHGCADAETAVFHAIYGCTQSVPMCSFYEKDGTFIKHGLVASYGFSGGDTTAETSKGFGSIQGSIRRGLAITKAIVQRRSYPCEILYKDSPQNYEPYDDDEIFAEHEFSKFSIVNQHYVDDEEKHQPGNASPVLTLRNSPSDADSGVWPQSDKWDTVSRQNYLDITVTSLPQHGGDDEFESGCPLSAILVRETMSRRDLLMGMGSQVSMTSLSSKNKPVILDKTDIIRGSEFVIKPCEAARSGPSNAQTTYLSRWTIDDVCIDASIQELHVKVDDCPVLMFSRAPGQPLSTPPQPKDLKLEGNDSQLMFDSSVA